MQQVKLRSFNFPYFFHLSSFSIYNLLSCVLLSRSYPSLLFDYFLLISSLFSLHLAVVLFASHALPFLSTLVTFLLFPIPVFSCSHLFIWSLPSLSLSTLLLSLFHLLLSFPASLHLTIFCSLLSFPCKSFPNCPHLFAVLLSFSHFVIPLTNFIPYVLHHPISELLLTLVFFCFSFNPPSTILSVASSPSTHLLSYLFSSAFLSCRLLSSPPHSTYSSSPSPLCQLSAQCAHCFHTPTPESRETGLSL